MASEWFKLLVPVFLGVQGLLAFWSAGSERPPAPPALAQFPRTFAGWTKTAEEPIDPAVAATLRADRLLSRTYANVGGQSAGLLVAWFQSQRAGASQPHSPKVCLPASGWTPESSGELPLSTAAGNIGIVRYVVSDGVDRAVVLYWYQSARRAVAGEWASKFWLVADAVRDHRSDTALVRIVVMSRPGGDGLATATGVDFARAAYPILRQRLPR